VRLRVGVMTDGIVRLTPADLAAAGVDPATVDPRTFALNSLGQPVAIRVAGEADGRFDPGDFVEFFGERFRGPEMDQKYTDERVYWLDGGGAPGPRIPDVDATPQGNLTPPADFATTLHAEQSNFWWTLHTLAMDTQDSWFWDRLQPQRTGRGITHTLPYPVPDPAPGFTATLRLEEISRAPDSSVNPDHRTTIGLNDALLADTFWDGKQRHLFTVAVPAGLLASGVNTVTVGALNPPGIEADDIYVNYWELDYHRQFRAWNGQLDFRAAEGGPHEYAVAGWPSVQVAVWDVSDPRWPRRLVGVAAAPAGAETRLRFRVNYLAGARYWLQTEASIAGPASLRLRPPTGLRQPAEGADAVIVTPADLRPAAEQLAGWHRGHGRRALVADIQDVYDEFNDGIYHPKAVPAMLAWARDYWPGPPPAYLTLVGDGHWNFKGFNPTLYPPEPNPIPPFLAWADPWQGEVPSDAHYGDINGDDLPEVAVGRLAVNTLAEAETVVAKIIAYDEAVRAQPWQQRALFVADNADSAGDFPASSEEIVRETLPADLTPERVYLGQTVPDAATAHTAISNALQSGVWLVQFAGHGAPERWTHEQIWRTTDVPGLRNADRLPVVMTFNCLDGYFAYPGRPSIAEIMQRQAGGGSIAAISPAGLGVIDDQQLFRRLLMETVFRDGVRELGQALTLAKQRFDAQYGWNYLLATMTLYGDPALRLPRPATGGNVYGTAVMPVSDARSGRPGDTVSYLLRVTNLGNVSDTFNVAITSTWATTAPVIVGPLAPDASATVNVQVAIPADVSDGATDTAQVTLTSQSDSSRSATAMLVTAAGSLYGVRLAPAIDVRLSAPGTAVIYTLEVSNTGNTADTFEVAASGRWAPVAPVSLGPLDPGANTTLTVTVNVPAMATGGAMDTATVVVTSQGNRDRSARAALTTIAQPHRRFLPIALR
jgi:hypothetical protein